MSKKFVAGRGYDRDDWEAVDSPELTEDELKTARPFAEAFPKFAEAIRKRGPQRTKTAVSIRLDDDVLARLRAMGPGWQSRVNEMLRKWVEKAPA